MVKILDVKITKVKNQSQIFTLQIFASLANSLSRKCSYTG
jgi:hypothetical protein